VREAVQAKEAAYTPGDFCCDSECEAAHERVIMAREIALLAARKRGEKREEELLRMPAGR